MVTPVNIYTTNNSPPSAYHQIEYILNSSDCNNNQRSTAWRQQTLLLQISGDTHCEDLIDRQWNRRSKLINENNILDNHLKSVQSLVGTGAKPQCNITFPDVDEITLSNNKFNTNIFDQEHQSVNSSTHPLSMLKTVQEFGIRSNPEIEVSEVGSKTEKEISGGRSCNTMEKFLQRPTSKSSQSTFCSARQLLAIQSMKKNMQNTGMRGQQRVTEANLENQGATFNFAATKKSLGGLGRVGNSNKKSFVSPIRCKSTTTKDAETISEDNIDTEMESLLAHPALKNVDTKMVELINNEIIHTFKPVDWNEIAGLDYAKSIIKEAVVYPLLRPDIFTGLRRPPRGILLFGPPGTGKTLIGKCIASQSSSTFFSISSASLTSKWMGEGEKMVRALFAVAVARQPSVIFIDEIDSLLSQRSASENEGTRRLKTEFLVRLDGAATSDDDRVVIVGATNRPQELDEAVRRRFVKRLYVPLPELDPRTEILANLLKTVENNLNSNELQQIAQLADGYSGSDMDSLCREASMEPLRSLPAEMIITFNKQDLRPVNIGDFHSALKKIRPSVSQNDLQQYVDWDRTYGSSY